MNGLLNPNSDYTKESEMEHPFNITGDKEYCLFPCAASND